MSVQSKLEKYAAARETTLAETPARQRIKALFDPDSFVEIDGFVSVDGSPCGVVCGYGSVMGSPVYAFAQDSSQGGGAVGKAHASKIEKIYDLALKTGVPVVGIYDSKGARVSEGAGALDAYGRILLHINNLSGVVPQISLVMGTCAGSAAMLACSADFVVMTEGAEFFLSAPCDGSDGAGTAAGAAKAGVAHLVRPDDGSAIEAVRKLLGMLPLNNLCTPPYCDFTEVSGGGAALSAACSSPESAKGRDTAQAVCDAGSPLEMLDSFGAGAYTALATMGGLPCGVVATDPGKLDPDCCVKIAKLVSVCDAFQIPVLTLVNASGFAVSAKAELCGAVRETAKLAHVYAEATTPKVAVITGEAYGAAYVALASRAANADYTVAWPCATISPLEPATAVAFQYADRITADKPRAAVEEEYRDNEASPLEAAKNGYIDDVIAPELTRPAVLAALDLLSAKRVSRNPKKHANMPI